MSHIKISVAIALFNGAKYIEEQLHSIINQSIHPDEIIICDDLSTDNSVDKIINFSTIFSFKIILIKNTHRLGFAQNFGKALSYCTGDIIFLADQDDVWLPHKIETILYKFKRNKGSWLYLHDGELTDENLLPSGYTKFEQVKRVLGKNARLTTGALTAITSELKDIALPIPLSIKSHDTWIHSLSDISPARVVVIDEVLQYIRRHSTNTSNGIINSIDKIKLIDIFISKFSHKASISYNDRLYFNRELISRIEDRKFQFKKNNVYKTITTYIENLEKEYKSIVQRQEFIHFSRFKKIIYAFKFLLNGGYKHFNGIQSFLLDILR